MAELANVGSRAFWEMLEKAYHDGTFEPHHYEWVLADIQVREGEGTTTRTCLRLIPRRPGESTAEFPFRGEPGPATDQKAVELIHKTFGPVPLVRER